MSLFFQFIRVFVQLMHKNTQNIRNTVLLICNYSISQIMKHLLPIKSLFFSLIILVCFASCTKDDVNADNQLVGITVKLKSTAGQFNKVFIEIEDVQLKIIEDDNTSNAWLSLKTINKGTYNIFDLRDDSELILVDNFEIKPTYIYEIRLVLGDNNFMDLNNTLYSLDVTDSGSSKPSNLVKIDLNPNHIYNFVIDIDIDKSISFNEDENMMILNPKIYTEITQF